MGKEEEWKAVRREILEEWESLPSVSWKVASLYILWDFVWMIINLDYTLSEGIAHVCINLLIKFQGLA